MRHFIKKIIFRKRNGITIGTNVRMHANEILNEVKHANSILLHCHPSPDPDSVCSALAMKFVLESMGKNVTVIGGDSEMPKGFLHFPGASSIIPKNILEIDLEAFDLFISVDSAQLAQITKKGDLIFPTSLRVVNIDHHATNKRFGHINLVESNYPACAQVLYELFLEWKIKMTRDIAENLFMGIYTDTVEFRTPLTTPKTFIVASKLVEFVPDIGSSISKMENSENKEHIKYVGLMLESIETHFDNKIAIAFVSYDLLQKNNISQNDIAGHNVSGLMRTVEEWQILMMVTEVGKDRVKVSIRSKDSTKYDVSKLAEVLGGGGHKAAAGILMLMPLEDAKKLLLSKAKEIFGL